MDRQNSSCINKSLFKFLIKVFSLSELKLRIKIKNFLYEIVIEFM